MFAVDIVTSPVNPLTLLTAAAPIDAVIRPLAAILIPEPPVSADIARVLVKKFLPPVSVILEVVRSVTLAFVSNRSFT